MEDRKTPVCDQHICGPRRFTKKLEKTLTPSALSSQKRLIPSKDFAQAISFRQSRLNDFADNIASEVGRDQSSSPRTKPEDIEKPEVESSDAGSPKSAEKGSCAQPEPGTGRTFSAHNSTGSSSTIGLCNPSTILASGSLGDFLECVASTPLRTSGEPTVGSKRNGRHTGRNSPHDCTRTSNL